MNKISVINSEDYFNAVKTVLNLSKLFSDNGAAPYLDYRLAENLFCQYVPNTVNYGRLDIAIDASLDTSIGVGIKTFVHGNGKTLQKIAEFNKEKSKYDKLVPKEKVKTISELRNLRLDHVKNNYDVEEFMYHCITRDKSNNIRFYNCPMDYIYIENIKDVHVNEATLRFTDGQNEYSFNLSKSTLYKRFDFTNVAPIKEFNMPLSSNPLEVLVEAFSNVSKDESTYDKEQVILPLYSYSLASGKNVPAKSGLNQWNASGRKRNPNEIYIPVSRKIHAFLQEKYTTEDNRFFPNRDTHFDLKLPDGKILEAKLCQDNSKALMTNPNKDLGKWILRKVLRLPEGKILTYDLLESIGIDSVIITKEKPINKDRLLFSIDFAPTGSYDEFVIKNNI